MTLLTSLLRPKIRPFARNRDRRRNARPREGRDHHIARAEQQYGTPLAFSYFYRRLIRTLLQREVGFLKEKRRMNGMPARACAVLNALTH